MGRRKPGFPDRGVPSAVRNRYISLYKRDNLPKTSTDWVDWVFQLHLSCATQLNVLYLDEGFE
jgi:hypothetical protein